MKGWKIAGSERGAGRVTPRFMITLSLALRSPEGGEKAAVAEIFRGETCLRSR